MSVNGDIVVSSNYMFVSYSEGLFYLFVFVSFYRMIGWFDNETLY